MLMERDLLVEEVSQFIAEVSYFDENHLEEDEDVKTIDDSYKIFILLEGKVDCQIEDELFHLTVNSVVVLKPRTSYKFVFSKKYGTQDIFRKIEFSFKLSEDEQFNELRTFLDNITMLNIFSYKELIEWEHFCFNCRNILMDKEFEICKKGFICQFVALLYSFYHDKVNFDEKRYGDKNELVTHVRAYIKQNLIYLPTTVVIAQKFHVSVNYLCKAFKKVVGISINQYVLTKKLELAKTLILEGERPMSAAYKVGFNDYSWFYKKFKERFDIAPNSLREKRVNTEQKSEKSKIIFTAGSCKLSVKKKGSKKS